MQNAGFAYRREMGIETFLDGPNAHARDAVHILFAEEKVRENDLLPNPSVSDSEKLDAFRVIKLEALVRMKLTSFRLKDRVHLVDMLQLGMIDRDWLPALPQTLAERLQELLDDPNEQE